MEIGDDMKPRFAAMSTLVFLHLLTCLLGLVHSSTAEAGDAKIGSRPRTIVTTDGEIDDRCSMVRFLLYANEWDTEGLIYCSSKYHWVGHDWAGETWIERDIDLYGQDYENLKQHAPGFPTPEALKAVTFVGNIDNVGEMEKETPGSNRIVEVLLDDNPETIFLQAWGGTNTIARALKTIQEKHSDQMPRVSQKAVIYIIQDQDPTFREYIEPNWPDLQVILNRYQFGSIAYGWKKKIPEEAWQFFQGPWMRENILKNHGPLCARYEACKKNDKRGLGEDDFRSEGDSPAFMYLIQTGLRNFECPSYGGWGGRFALGEDGENVWRETKDDKKRDKPQWRWAEDFQNDWAARADWCVKSVDEANHNPTVVVNGLAGKGIVRLQAKPGNVVSLSATGTADPDGNELTYDWWYYNGPSNYKKEVAIKNAKQPNANFTVPKTDETNEHHVVLTVRDNGEPNLVSYRRIIVSTE